MKRKIYFILFVGIALFFSCKKTDENAFVNEVASDKSNFDFLPTSTTNQIVVHDNYTLSYNEKYEQAEWVAYHLTKKQLAANQFKRPFFIEDPKVETHSADWRNYKKSGYDKGHLCPAGDMKFSQQAFDDTFYTSNISPQLHNFNDGVWNRLEQKTRYWASKYNDLYIITGGVLGNGLKNIGKEHVAVPNYFYKIVCHKSDGKWNMIGFLVPHKESDLPLYEFVVSVDKIEQLTKIDLFPRLEEVIENQLEKKVIIKIGALINYHSFTLLASIFRNIKSKIVNPQSPEPP